MSREEGSGTRDVLAAALTVALIPARGEKSASRAVPPATLALSTTAAVRAAALAGAGLAVLSELAVAEDLASHRLARVPVTGVNLRRLAACDPVRRTVPPMGAARGLLAHVTRQH